MTQVDEINYGTTIRMYVVWSVPHSQYHACWYSRSQGIGRYGIDPPKPDYFVSSIRRVKLFARPSDAYIICVNKLGRYWFRIRWSFPLWNSTNWRDLWKYVNLSTLDLDLLTPIQWHNFLMKMPVCTRLHIHIKYAYQFHPVEMSLLLASRCSVIIRFIWKAKSA